MLTKLIFFRLVMLNSMMCFEILFGKQCVLHSMLQDSGVLLITGLYFITPCRSNKQAFPSKGLDMSFSQE